MPPEEPAPAAGEYGADDPDRDEANDAADTNAGKVQAALVYALCIVHLPAGGGLALPFTIPGIPYFGLTLITRHNRFALYHAKQAALLWLAMVLGTILTNFSVTMIIGHILDFGAIALAIVGLVRVANGLAIPLPVVGRWAEQLLASLRLHESDQ